MCEGGEIFFSLTVSIHGLCGGERKREEREKIAIFIYISKHYITHKETSNWSTRQAGGSGGDGLCLEKHQRWLRAFYLLQVQVTEYRK